MGQRFFLIGRRDGRSCFILQSPKGERRLPSQSGVAVGPGFWDMHRVCTLRPVRAEAGLVIGLQQHGEETEEKPAYLANQPQVQIVPQ